MATCKFKIGDRVIVGESNIGNQYIGQVGVVADIDCTYDYPYCVNGTSYGNRLWCKATGCEEKIVVINDGKTTTATKYCADGSKVTATARCAPEDEFDFNVGAELAMERLMEKVTPNEPPKYYNGKVVCVDNGYTDLTVGKIYTFVDGCAKSNYGGQITKSPVKDFNDLASRFPVTKFIEIVEDENEPLTIEEIRKMDGQKVYVVRLDGGKVETPDHSYCGWHTVDVKKGQLIDSKNMHYNITSMDQVHGYHAYRQAPLK